MIFFAFSAVLGEDEEAKTTVNGLLSSLEVAALTHFSFISFYRFL